jgi:hypothetical protein
MIRKWLRALIGWEDVGKALKAQAGYLKSLEDLIQAQDKEIQAIKYQRDTREQKKQRSQILDWEQQVADYAANPENFKEN